MWCVSLMAHCTVSGGTIASARRGCRMSVLKRGTSFRERLHPTRNICRGLKNTEINEATPQEAVLPKDDSLQLGIKVRNARDLCKDRGLVLWPCRFSGSDGQGRQADVPH